MVATLMRIFCMYCKTIYKEQLVGNGQTEGSGICEGCLEAQMRLIK